MQGTVDSTRTYVESQRQLHPDGPLPGLLLVFSGGVPRCEALAVPSTGLVLGRGHGGLEDPHLSREHALVSLTEGDLSVKDLGSRNGTFINGARVNAALPLTSSDVLRVGESVFLACTDLRSYFGARVAVSDGLVIGPRMRQVFAAVKSAADARNRLLITGETGSGKEMVARAYHECTAPQGPFVPLNCAALPATLAEGLLFGVARGAYSGATADRIGYLAQADSGVVLLDEIAELDLQIQAKLLRVIETGEVQALGSARALKIQIRICAATHQDLLTLVDAGKFRADLYYRLAESTVRVPPLRERREEIPWFIANELGKSATPLTIHRLFVESCLVRPWLGNARAFVASIRAAVTRAEAEHSKMLRPEHLPADARATSTAPLRAPSRGPSDVLERESVELCLKRHDGNLTKAALELGLHRTQLYRVMKRLGMRGERTASLAEPSVPEDDWATLSGSERVRN